MDFSAASGVTLASLRVPQRAALVVLGAIGVASPFLPFTYATSPLEVVVAVDGFPGNSLLVLIAAPFFLAPLAFVISLRALVFDRFAAADALAAWLASLAMTLATLSATVWPVAARDELGAGDWVVVAAAWCAIAAGTALVGHCVRRGLPPAVIALTSMHCAYIANAVFCLGVFWPHWEAGAVVSAIAVAAFAVHIAMLVAHAVPDGDRALRGGSR